MYPVEHGWLVALASLGSFPEGTRFRPIDDIDHCVLLLAEAEGISRDKHAFSGQNFHVALWHEDVLALVDKGYATGPVGVTEAVHELNKRLEIESRPPLTSMPEDGPPELGQFSVEVEGTPGPSNLPPLDEYDDEIREWACFPSSRPLTMTLSGGRRWTKHWVPNRWCLPRWTNALVPFLTRSSTTRPSER